MDFNDVGGEEIDRILELFDRGLTIYEIGGELNIRMNTVRNVLIGERRVDGHTTDSEAELYERAEELVEQYYEMTVKEMGVGASTWYRVIDVLGVPRKRDIKMEERQAVLDALVEKYVAGEEIGNQWLGVRRAVFYQELEYRGIPLRYS